jgi:hypothetical protein
MFNKIIIIILAVLTAGCSQQNQSMDNVSEPSSTSVNDVSEPSSTSVNDVLPAPNPTNHTSSEAEETSSKSVENPYFFPSNAIKKTYMISDVNAFDEGYQECNLEINLLGHVGVGKLYDLRIVDSNLKKHSTIITRDRTDLGFFYVTDDKIYKMTRAEGQNFLSSAKSSNSVTLPVDAQLVCQSTTTLNKDYYRYEWAIGDIENEDDICEFDSFENRDEYYEYIAWKKGIGIVYYSNGWGGEEGGIYMMSQDSKVYESINNYEYALPQAINSGNFDLISSFLIAGMNLYNSQKELVSRLYNEEIKLQLNSFYIYSVDRMESGKIRINMKENIGVKHPGESDFTDQTYRGGYWLTKVNGQVGLIDIKKTIY